MPNSDPTERNTIKNIPKNQIKQNKNKEISQGKRGLLDDNRSQYGEKLENIQTFEFNEILKVPSRFKIMFLLYNYNEVNFTEIRKLLQITSGNCMHHLNKLCEINWVEEKVDFMPRVLKYYKIMPLGEKKFAFYINGLKKIVDSIDL